MSSVTEQTSAGTVEVVFGVNGWVVVSRDRGDRLQERVSSAGELADLLRSLHLMDEEARAVAERLWRERPSDFAAPSAQRGESILRGTGLPFWAQLGLLLVLIAVGAYLLYKLGGR